MEVKEAAARQRNNNEIDFACQFTETLIIWFSNI